MNPSYAEYIATARQLAKGRGLDWDLVFDDRGTVSKDTRWNLTELMGMLPPPTIWLGQLGVDQTALGKLNKIRQAMNQEPLASGPMPQHWRDLYQAVFVHKLLIAKTKPHSVELIAHGIRRLCPAAEGAPPWAITPEHIQQAYNAVLRSAGSGKLALDFVTMVRTIIDEQKLADIPELTRFCIPYPTSESLSAELQAQALRKRQNAHGGKQGLRRSLSERKSAAKLPEERAFWELARIVFTETPRSFSDAIRFAVFKVQIIMGFRIGEAVRVPLDWKRWREYPHELMFIMPVRNVIEGRNNGILDTTMYSAIGRIDRGDLIGSTSGKGCEPLFERYGMTEEDRALRLTPHALRHLQNTELFRLGVADTIITKKFNRRSVQQSYVYDHRSLAEDLADIDLPPEAAQRLGDKAKQVSKLISADKARGPVVEEFRRVQREYGEAAAFDYLNAEADGLHVTPYGLCINSFTSDPCPTHLECFNGCLHLARTAVISEQENLERMRDRFAKVIIKLEAMPEHHRNIGWANQISHARVRYENIVKALGTDVGTQVFPEGSDLSVTAEQKAGTTIIDTMKRLRDLDD